MDDPRIWCDDPDECPYCTPVIDEDGVDLEFCKGMHHSEELFDGHRKEARHADYGYNPYGTDRKGNPKVNWKRYIDGYMDKWMERHAQDIIDEAALLMAMRGSRKKAWREVLDELKAERDAE